MKDRLLDHIVKATTERRGLVLLATLVLCGVSVLSTVTLLESDMTFKGMIGQTAPPVKAYDKVIRDFSVSGVISVALEPQPQAARSIAGLRAGIDALVFEGLDAETRAGLLKLVGLGADAMDALGERERLLTLVDLFRMLDPPARRVLVNGAAKLNDDDRAFVLQNADSIDDQVARAVYRKFQKLSPKTLALLAKKSDNISKTNKKKLSRVVLSRMSVYDKKGVLEESKALDEAQKQAKVAKLDAAEAKISAVLATFRKNALDFATKLKAGMRQTTALPGMKEAPSALVKGVLYSEEFSFSKDQLMVLVMVSPQKDIDQMKNARQFCTVVDLTLASMKPQHKELMVRRTGFAAAQIDARKAMFEDFGVMMAVTIIGILLVSLIGLRSVEFPLLAMVPLSLGIVVMFGIYAVFGQLNLVSMMTPIILFGLGIDYAIHLGARYGEVRLELGPDAEPAQVLRGAFSSVGPGMVVASITTVFAFLSLLVSTISGLSESGLMAATGVVSAFLAMAYLMPLLIVWRERIGSKKGARFLRTGRLTWLGQLADSRAGLVLALLLLALALSAVYYIPQIRLERDGMKLSPDGLESITLSKDLEAKFEFTDAQAYFVVQGYDKLKAFRRELARETDDGRPVYPAINTMRVMDARKAIRTFEKLGWDRDAKTLDRFAQKYAAKTNLMGGSNKHIAEVYAFIARNYVDHERDAYLIIVPPSGYVWDSDLTEAFSADLARLEKTFGVEAASFVRIWKFLVDHLLGDLISSTAVAFALVLLVLLLITRSLTGTLICAVVLAASLAGTLALIGALRLQLNCVNIIAFPITIGLGIDYIVHIYYRLVHEEQLDIVGAVSSTGKAVLLTTLTTLVAFGAISFSAHKGLSQMGKFSFIGLTVSLLASLFLLPTLVKWVHGGKKAAPIK